MNDALLDARKTMQSATCSAEIENLWVLLYLINIGQMMKPDVKEHVI